MRRAAKIDDNQNQIVKGLRKCGFTVRVLSSVGKGFPDIIVGARKLNFLFEIKDENKSESRRQLTPDEKAFHDSWKGQIDVIKNLDEALAIINK